jgi:flagellar basal body-associated protein FliL
MVFMRPATSSESETKADEAAAPVDDMAEVSIGTGFHCTNNRAAAGSTINVDFKLVALVPRSHAVTFKDALNAHDGRIREAIMRVIRGSSLDDLQDAHLSNIKRLIREEINKILAKDFVTEVVISEYTTFDQ